MGRNVTRFLLVAVIALPLVCCGWAARPADGFDDARRDFAQRLRWKDFQGAARHLAEEHREAFLAQFSGLDDLNIVDVSYDAVEPRQEVGEAEAWLVLEYYLLPSATVKKLRLHQEWAYLGGDRLHSGRWQVTSVFPTFP